MPTAAAAHAAAAAHHAAAAAADAELRSVRRQGTSQPLRAMQHRHCCPHIRCGASRAPI